MENNYKDKESQRFIETIEALIERKEVKSFYALAQTLNILDQRFTDIKAGRQSVTKKLVDELCGRFIHVSKIYITTGEGEMFIDKESQKLIKDIKKINPKFKNENFTTETEKRIAELEKENEWLRRENENLREIIRLLKEKK